MHGDWSKRACFLGFLCRFREYRGMYCVPERAWIAMNYERDYGTPAALFRRTVKLDLDNPVILESNSRGEQG